MKAPATAETRRTRRNQRTGNLCVFRASAVKSAPGEEEKHSTSRKDPSPLIPLPLGRGEGSPHRLWRKHGTTKVVSLACRSSLLVRTRCACFLLAALFLLLFSLGAGAATTRDPLQFDVFL